VTRWQEETAGTGRRAAFNKPFQIEPDPGKATLRCNLISDVSGLTYSLCCPAVK